MSSVTEICNLASSHARQDASIVNLETDNSTLARRLRKIYSPTLKRVTQSFPWWFSERPVAVSLLEVEAADGFDYVYQVPGDVLEVSKVSIENMSYTDINTGSDTTIFKVMTSSDGLTKQIHTTIEIDFATCIRTVKTNNVLDPLFVEYFAYELARQLANIYKLEKTDRELLLKELMVAKSDAMISSTTQEDESFDTNNKYVEARGGA